MLKITIPQNTLYLIGKPAGGTIPSIVQIGTHVRTKAKYELDIDISHTLIDELACGLRLLSDRTISIHPTRIVVQVQFQGPQQVDWTIGTIGLGYYAFTVQDATDVIYKIQRTKGPIGIYKAAELLCEWNRLARVSLVKAGLTVIPCMTFKMATVELTDTPILHTYFPIIDVDMVQQAMVTTTHISLG